MDRKLAFVYCCVVLSMVIISCCDDVVDPSFVEKAKIAGDWSVVNHLEERDTDTDTLIRESDSQFELLLNEDGSGLIRAFNLETAIDWVYQYEPEIVVISERKSPFPGIPNLRPTTFFDILSIDDNDQLWVFSTSSFNSGINISTTITWALSR